MKRTFIILLQIAVALVGVTALAVILLKPHIEDGNIRTLLSDIRFNDPFLWYIYVASVPFLIIPYQAFKLLRYGGQDDFSQQITKALRTIRYCALAIVVFAVIGEVTIMLNHSHEDPESDNFMAILIALVSAVFAVVAFVFERVLQKANTGFDHQNTYPVTKQTHTPKTGTKK